MNNLLRAAGTSVYLLLLTLPAYGSVIDWQSRMDTCSAEYAAHLGDLQEDPELEGVEIDYTALETVCPDFVTNLEQHPWRSMLDLPLRDWTLADAQGLLNAEGAYALVDSQPRLDVAGVGGVLDTLPDYAEEEISLWSRLMSWLNERFGGEEGELPDWWPELSVTDQVFDWILYVSIFLVVLMALGIVINEIVQHRKGRRRALEPDAWRAEDEVLGASLSIANLRDAPPWKQPGLLLDLLVTALQKEKHADSGFMFRPGMTPRFIVGAAQDLPQGETVGEVAFAAERATYGGWRPEANDLEALLRKGTAAIAELEKKA